MYCRSLTRCWKGRTIRVCDSLIVVFFQLELFTFLPKIPIASFSCVFVKSFASFPAQKTSGTGGLRKRGEGEEMTTSDDDARKLFARPVKPARKRSPKLRSTSALGSDAASTSKRKQQTISSDSDSPRLATPPVTVRKAPKRITLDSSDEASETEESSRARTKRKLFGDIGLNGTGGTREDSGRKAVTGKGWKDASSEQDGKSLATATKLHSVPRPPGRPGVQESAAKKVTNSKSVTKPQHTSLSPPPAAQPNHPPIKAQSFWGAGPPPVVKPPPKLPFEQSKRLASLSTIGKRLERPRNEEEDEIDMLDEVEELKDVVGGDGNYVTYEAGVKQKKAASLRSSFSDTLWMATERYRRTELLKEKRQIKQAITPAPKAAGLFSASTSDEQCALCNKLVRSALLSLHAISDSLLAVPSVKVGRSQRGLLYSTSPSTIEISLSCPTSLPTRSCRRFEVQIRWDRRQSCCSATTASTRRADTTAEIEGEGKSEGDSDH